MTTRLAEAKSELEALLEDKAKAIEAEDFDKAYALKSREKKLKDHIIKKNAEAEGKTDL